jgi:hypothetical protein
LIFDLLLKDWRLPGPAIIRGAIGGYRPDGTGHGVDGISFLGNAGNKKAIK